MQALGELSAALQWAQVHLLPPLPAGCDQAQSPRDESHFHPDAPGVHHGAIADATKKLSSREIGRNAPPLSQNGYGQLQWLQSA